MGWMLKFSQGATRGESKTLSKYDREHVTPWIKIMKNIKSCFKNNIDLSNFRLTVDEKKI